MEDQGWLDALRDEGAAFARTLGGDQAAAVPGCPGWDLSQLAVHLGVIHRNVTDMALAPADQRTAWHRVADPGPGPELEPWFVEGLDGLVTALAGVDPDEVVQTFVGPQPRRFWRRRQAQETAVHRWDAESTNGRPTPIDADLAADGIDEMLDVFLPIIPAERLHLDRATAHLHATDGAGEWLIHFDPERVSIERRHAKGDVALRGTASELLLALWGRLDADDLEVFGDVGVFTRWRAALSR